MIAAFVSTSGGTMSHSYKDPIAWQKAIALTTELYRATTNFPQHEIYGLTSQLRRAAVSVASNIAEGQGRNTVGEFKQFLGHARGSLLEIETQLVIAQNLRYIEKNKADDLLASSGEVFRLVNGLLSSLDNASNKKVTAANRN
jgi:four helix bundle protein